MDTPTALAQVQTDPAVFWGLDRATQLLVLTQLIDLSGRDVELLDPVRAIANSEQRRLIMDLLGELQSDLPPAPKMTPYRVRAQEALDKLNSLID